MHATPTRIETPYPLSTDRFLDTVKKIADSLPKAARVTVGVPGMIRNGVVVATPHYINDAGPHTRMNQELKDQWWGFDAQAAIEEKLGIPTKVLNDAEVHGAGVDTLNFHMQRSVEIQRMTPGLVIANGAEWVIPSGLDACALWFQSCAQYFSGTAST